MKIVVIGSLRVNIAGLVGGFAVCKSRVYKVSYDATNSNERHMRKNT